MQGTASAQDAATSQARCLEAHEQAQVDRIEIRLRAAAEKLRTCADVDCPSVIRGDCIRWTDEVERGIPTVIFAARSEAGDESDVKVYANDELLTPRLDGRPIELDPGPYQFRFERPPAAPEEKQVILREGEKNRVVSVDFDLFPDEAAPADTGAGTATTGAGTPTYVDRRPPPPLAILFGSLAVVSGGGAVAFGMAARTAHAEASDTCSPVCSDDTVASIRRQAIVTDVAAGVAVLAAGAATYFYFTRPTRQRPAVTALGFRPAPRGGFVMAEGALW